METTQLKFLWQQNQDNNAKGFFKSGQPYNRFHAEEQGGLQQGGRIHVEASVITGREGKPGEAQDARAAAAILDGTAYIDILSLEEEAGRSRGGETNVEASLVIRASNEASREGSESDTRQDVIWV